MMAYEGNLLWIDVETTGLSPKDEWVLEVGAIVTTPGLVTIDEREWLIQADAARAFAMCGPTTRRMHLENGLFLALETQRYQTTPLDVADAELHAWLLEHGCQGSPLCGSSVHFDRGFMHIHLPATDGELSHRNLDVRTMLECIRMWHGAEPPQGEPPHRALADARIALANMRWAQEFVAGRQGG